MSLTSSLIRPSILVCLGASLASLALACTVTVKTQNKYVPPSGVSKTALTAWTGQAIVVENANGTTTVVGDATATTVSVSATPFAFADNEADGTAAINDEAATIKLDESSGRFSVSCGQASASHGTAGVGTTGCDLKVTIPAGSAANGVVLSVHSRNGGVTVRNVYAADAPNQLTILTDNGEAEATGINGGAKVRTENGGATASIAPRKGSVVEVSSGNGDVTLSLPSDFAADALRIKGKKVTVTGFGDLSGTSTSRGTAGTGAASVTASCDNLGDVTVKPQ